MRSHLRGLLIGLLFLVPAVCEGEVLIRWTEPEVPPTHSLGVVTLVMPAANREAIRAATAEGYRVFAEVPGTGSAAFSPPSGLAGLVVKGAATKPQLTALRQRLGAKGRVLTLDERGTWPHIRANWVTKNNDVVQVTGRSAQPWIESNAGVIRVAQATAPGAVPVLAYEWTGMTLSDVEQGPALENYLVAIAEAGSFGADVVLPLHKDFQRQLLLAHPDARRKWQEIRRYIEFYAGNVTRHYTPVADVGVVTGSPMVWVEVMDLMARHNLSFALIDPSQLAAQAGGPIATLVVLEPPDAARAKALAAFERGGGSVILALASAGEAGPHAAEFKHRVIEQDADPDRFALDLRRLLGPERRALDIWNGITVLAAPYTATGKDDVLVTLVNYAHQPLPVQLRVRGTFARVHFESPEEGPVLLPHEHRGDRTEFVVPAVRVGGRIFLSR